MMRAIVPVRPWALPALLVMVLMSALSACGKQEQDDKAQGAAAPIPEVGVIAVQPRDVAIENEYAGRTAGYREVEVSG